MEVLKGFFDGGKTFSEFCGEPALWRHDFDKNDS
jgi:hypothetical protein